MKLWAEAAKEWAEHPLGPNVNLIYQRLYDEAVARGEFDDLETT